MKKTQTGFTIIELTIVILVISVVSALLIIPFKINFQISRDTVRKANVNLIANTIKLEKINNFNKNNINNQSIVALLNKNLISLPRVEADNHYFYGYSAKKNDFFIVVCGEAYDEFFVAGTINGISAVRSVYAGKSCKNNLVPVKTQPYPLDKKAPNNNLDAYFIYKLT